MPATGLQPQRIRSEVSLLGSKSVHASPVPCLGAGAHTLIFSEKPKIKAWAGPHSLRDCRREASLISPSFWWLPGSLACGCPQPLPPPHMAFFLCVVCLFLFCFL